MPISYMSPAIGDLLAEHGHLDGHGSPLVRLGRAASATAYRCVAPVRSDAGV